MNLDVYKRDLALVTTFLIASAICKGSAQGPQGNSAWSLDPFLGKYNFVLDTAKNVSDLIVMLGVPENVASGPTSIEWSKIDNGTRYQQRTLRSDPKYNAVLPFILSGPEVTLNIPSGAVIRYTFTMTDQFTLQSHILYQQAPNISVEYAPRFTFKADASEVINPVDVISPRQFQSSVTLIRDTSGPYN